jgi:hypothetical protein
MLNLLQNLEEVKAAFELMEGRIALENNSEYGFMGVLERFQLVYFLNYRRTCKGKCFGFSAVIYGDGGMNRYFVKDDGNIYFSSHHAAWPKEETIEKAKSLGFEVI